MNEKGVILKMLNGADLSKFSKEHIYNHYVAKIKPGKHSLVIPLGAKADLIMRMGDILLEKTKPI
ncbi:TQO small subunit DoxA domain-containing protein [Olivibacter sp. SDN3]|uniref:TQO small subunit DoxA domain-containing protein n=1 Tax=Olivibacter sp. SDN3 TaxID=2764720 RepID=UPI002102F451|nr:TQO small subunit DoxA domain-containing protein [Olivibacter sp. SDN3]